MDSSPLGKLPPELRNTIYALALTAPHTIKLAFDVDNHEHLMLANGKNITALTQTCKQRAMGRVR